MINGAISGASATQHTHRHHESGNAQNFKALDSSLQSGDLAGAQKAFQALQQNAPKGGANSNSPMAKDMEALGKALSSGDVGAAQKAFATIQTDMQARRAKHSGQASPPTTPTSDPDGDGDNHSGSTINIKV